MSESVNLRCGCGATLSMKGGNEMGVHRAAAQFQDDHRDCPKKLAAIDARLAAIEDRLDDIAVAVDA